MSLKSVLTSLDGLSDDLKKEYTEKDGKFYLDLEGLDEHHAVGALKRAKDHEKSLRQKAEEKQREAEDKVTEHETVDPKVDTKILNELELYHRAGKHFPLTNAKARATKTFWDKLQ